MPSMLSELAPLRADGSVPAADPAVPWHWHDALQRLLARGQTAVLVTVVATRGSAPRDAGAHMVVTQDGLYGTIGGGHLEYQAIAQARQWLLECGGDLRGSVAPGRPWLQGTNRTGTAGLARACNATDAAFCAPPEGHGTALRARADIVNALLEGCTPLQPQPMLRELALGASLGQCCGGAVQILFEWVSPHTLRWLPDAQRARRQQQPWARIVSLDAGTAAACCVVRRGADVPQAGVQAPAPAVAAAHALLAGSGPQVQIVEVGRADGPAGQAQRWMVDAWVPPPLAVALFGAGHVGRAIAHCAANLPLHMRWIDSRASEFPASVCGNIAICHSDDPVGEVALQPAGAAYLILTHRHDLDFALTRAVLDRGDFAYLGLIGSATKRLSFEQRLRARGYTEAQLERITCPIGVPGIDGKEPAVIAVAVLAQLLQLGTPTSG